MSNETYSPAYWAVYPDFLISGAFTIEQRNDARIWCEKNCQDLFKCSDLRPWAFLDKSDAEAFAMRFGGELKYKLEEIL